MSTAHVMGGGGMVMDVTNGGCKDYQVTRLEDSIPSPHPSREQQCITCLLIPTGRLEPLVARLIGATTATRVGDGADCLFLGGSAGGLEETERGKQECFRTISGNRT